MGNRLQLATRVSFAELLATPSPVRQQEGYGDTLAEIWQQPELWRETATRVLAQRPAWSECVRSAEAMLLTGSGSSYFVGQCVAPALQESLGIPVTAVESGEILMQGHTVLPGGRPLLVVSFARSGDSPESWGLVRQLLDSQPETRHLLITCNPDGRLARTWGDGGTDPDPRVRAIVLDKRTCDRSLVMTSSFTSMAVAALGLATAGRRKAVDEAAVDYLDAVETLAGSVAAWLDGGLAPLEDFPIDEMDRLVTVGSGPLYGTALEVALKVLEMSDGRVATRPETCLGLRHGPMCALRSRSVLFLPLSGHAARRVYQLDLLEEMARKRVGGRKVLTGARIPESMVGPGDLAIPFDAMRHLGDQWLAIASVVAGQLLGFLRCLAEGLRPDEPAPSDSIARVVGHFTLHNLSGDPASNGVHG